MQIVIDIPKEQYSLIMQSHRSGVTRFIDKEAMIYAIKNGTPLPKGHGRLIDADKLETDIEEYKEEWTWYGSRHGYSCEQVDNAPTIIEANKE